MANTTCPGNAIPEISSMPVPQDINIMVIPGTNTSDTPMVTCCEPSQVHVVDECWLWCEVPASYFNGTDNEGARRATSACLRTKGRNFSESSITGWQFNAAGRTGMGSAMEISLWVLALSGLMNIL